MTYSTHFVWFRPHTAIKTIIYQILECVEPYFNRYE